MEEQLNKKQQKLIKRLTSPLLFKTFCLFKIPLLALTNTKVTQLSTSFCTTTVPFKHLNKNPFKSMYFAVQSMAAELSTASLAMLALEEFNESIAYIVTNCSATFTKKADNTVTFKCIDYDSFKTGIQKAVSTGESVEISVNTIGTLPNGQEVASFTFTWSFKKRS